MRKRIGFLMASVLIVCMVAAGCGGNNTPVAAVPESETPEVLVEESEVLPEVEVESEVASEEAIEEVAEEDPLEKVPLPEVTLEAAKDGGLVCLCRDNKLYSLGPYVFRKNENNGYDTVLGWWKLDEKTRMSVSELSSFEINKDTDQIYDFNNPYYYAYGCSYIGTTIPIFWNNTFKCYQIIDRKTDPLVPTSLEGADDLKIMDGEEILSGWENLEPNKEYTLFWYKGVDYHEIVIKADYDLYEFNNEPLEKLNVEPTKDGYVIVDISTLEPGTYYIGNGYYAFPANIK